MPEKISPSFVGTFVKQFESSKKEKPLSHDAQRMLLERDGKIEGMRIALGAKVTINNEPSDLSLIRVGDMVACYGNPAELVAVSRHVPEPPPQVVSEPLHIPTEATLPQTLPSINPHEESLFDPPSEQSTDEQ